MGENRANNLQYTVFTTLTGKICKSCIKMGLCVIAVVMEIQLGE